MRLELLSFPVALLALIPVACSSGQSGSAEPEVGEALGSASAALTTTDTYEIKGVDSGKCIDIANAGTADGTTVQLWDCNKGPGQQFKLEDMGSGYYRLRNPNSNKCLDVWNLSTSNGGVIKLYTCTGGANQSFRITEMYGQASFQNQNSGLFMEVSGLGSGNGTLIQQWNGTNNENQFFRLNKLTGSSCQIPSNFSWKSSAMMVDPVSDATHSIVSVKDPSIVYYNHKWHVYASTANTAGGWNMVYFNFGNWGDAGNAPMYYMDQTPGLGGYKCAPHVFYYSPQSKWYMVYQTQPPSYSTNTDISNPAGWTSPVGFFGSWPVNMPGLPIDYNIICDDNYCYMYFTGDNGALYRSRTTRAAFPNGMSDPDVALRIAPNDAFEASQTYKVQGMNKYVTMIEARGTVGRYFRLWQADALDGVWTPVVNSETRPFAGASNVSYPYGDWTDDVSHGELVRAGYDERMELDLCSGTMQFLYQGRDPSINTSYSQLPYRLGLLWQGASDSSIPPLSAPPSPNNAFSNGDGESGTATGWSARGATMSAVTSPKRSGAYALKSSNRTQTWQGPNQDVTSAVYAGQEYFARTYATVGSGTQNVMLTLAVNCGGTTTYSNVASATVSAGSWAALQGRVTMPTCSNLQSVNLYVEGPPAGVDLIMDDAVLQ